MEVAAGELRQVMGGVFDGGVRGGLGGGLSGGLVGCRDGVRGSGASAVAASLVVAGASASAVTSALETLSAEAPEPVAADESAASAPLASVLAAVSTWSVPPRVFGGIGIRGRSGEGAHQLADSGGVLDGQRLGDLGHRRCFKQHESGQRYRDSSFRPHVLPQL